MGKWDGNVDIERLYSRLSELIMGIEPQSKYDDALLIVMELKQRYDDLRADSMRVFKMNGIVAKRNTELNKKLREMLKENEQLKKQLQPRELTKQEKEKILKELYEEGRE